MNLRDKLRAIEPGIAASPWRDHEFLRGYAVMVLPFSSGDLLGLRVWPQNDFAPYASVWHRTAGGEWSIYSDGPLIETTCPRYWGPALEHAELVPIELTWTGPSDLRVTMEEPSLTWTMTMTAPPLVHALNAVSAAQPLWTWKPAPLRRMRERIAGRFLGMGDIRISFTAPSGHDVIIMPQEQFFIEKSEAVLEGRDLGLPVRLDENPTIGGVPLPACAVFTVGEAHARIKDPAEYRRTREQLRV